MRFSIASYAEAALARERSKVPLAKSGADAAQVKSKAPRQWGESSNSNVWMSAVDVDHIG